MRVDSLNFKERNISARSTPAAVIEIHFDNTGTDILWLTSHDVVGGIPGATDVILKCLSDINDVSQSMDWRTYTSSVGKLDFSAIDVNGDISAYMRARFNENKSAGFKFCKYYKGFEDIQFSEFTLACTQTITTIDYDDGEYQFSCDDIQRETRKNIFEPKIAIATANITASATTINVSSTSGFEMCQHGNSYSDSPNVKIGYLRVKNNDTYEILRYTGKTSNTFTGVTHGAFGTVAQDWQAIKPDGSSAELEVEEFIYFELPVPKAIYAILTGVIYNSPGETFPWNLGISDLWVATPYFTNIGVDLWDPSNDSTGFICRFSGLQKEKGMQFIQEQLLALAGLIMPVISTGELALRKVTDVPSSAPFVTTLTKDHIVKMGGGVKYAINEIKNILKIRWSWDSIEDAYLRTDIFPVSGSIARYGKEEVTEKEFKGLHGSRHSRDSNILAFRAWRDRLASEPLYLNLQLMPGLDILEICDIVRIELTDWEDYTAEQVAELNRSFEVQSVRSSWLDGVVDVSLFGSSARLPPNIDDTNPGGATTAFTNGQLTTGGTNIETAYAGSVSRSGGLVTLTADITFAGHTQLATSAGVLENTAKLYCNGDLSIPFGRTLNIQKDTVLICTGFITIDGTIQGKGQGKAGGGATRYNSLSQPTDYGAKLRITSRNVAVPQAGRGFIGPRMIPQGEIVGVTTPTGGELAYRTSHRRVDLPDAEADGGLSPLFPYSSVPEFELKPATLGGFPPTLQGSGGPAGLALYEAGTTGAAAFRNAGSSGGNGGAGLLIIARGVSFGVSGQINLSGNDAGTTNNLAKPNPGHDYYSQPGSGCPGAPGSLLIVIDGDNTAPIISAASFKANCGQASYKTTNTLVGNSRYGGSENKRDVMSGLLPTFSVIENYWAAYSRVQFVFSSTAVPGEDTPSQEIPGQIQGLVITQYNNLPQTPEGNMVTVSVNVTPPVVTTNYAYAVVGYKKAADSSYSFIPVVAQNETSFAVKGDGTTYNIIAFAISKTGVQHPVGVTTNVTVTTAATLPAGTKMEIGYDAVTGTFQRLIDIGTGTVIVGLSATGQGLSGKVTAGGGSSGYDNLADRPDFSNHINSGGDLIENSRHLIAAADGRPAGVRATFSNTDPTTISYLDKPNGFIKLAHPSDTTIGMAYPAFRVNPNTKYRLRISVKASVAASSGFWFRVAEYDQQSLPPGVSHVAYTGVSDGEAGKFVPGTSVQNVISDGALTTGWVEQEFTYTPTNGARWTSLIMLKYSPIPATTELHVRLVSATPIINSDATTNKVYRQAAAPSSGMAAQDLWIDTDDGNRLYYYSGSAWLDSRDAGISTALANAATAQATADGKIVTYRQTTAPSSGMGVGDFWIDSDDGNKLYRYSGSAWVDSQDTGIVTAITSASNAQTTANSRITTFYTTSTPTALALGDLWYNINTQTVKRWNGSTWVEISAYVDFNKITSSNDLIQNSRHYLIGPDGNPAGVLGSYTATGVSNVVTYLDSNLGHAKFWRSGNQAISAAYPAFRIDVGTKYKIRFSVKASAAMSQGFYARMTEYDTNVLPDGVTHINFTADAANSRFVNGNRFVSLAFDDTSLSTTWVTYEVTYTPTSTAKWASFHLQKLAPAAAATEMHVRLASIIQIIDSSADNTTTAINNEVTTTGGLILSTDGLIRTTGKVDVDDGIEGVLLGDIAGDKSFYAGDGADDFISYKEGVGLEIGKDVQIRGVSTALSLDQSIIHPKLNLFDTQASGTMLVSYSANDGAITMSTAIDGNSAAGLYSRGFLKLNALPFLPAGWTVETMGAAVVDPGVSTSGDGIQFFIGAGQWHPTTAARCYGVVFKPAGIYAVAADGTIKNEVLLYSGFGASSLAGGTVVKWHRHSTGVYIEVDTRTNVYSTTLTSNVPTDTFTSDILVEAKLWVITNAGVYKAAKVGEVKILRKAP